MVRHAGKDAFKFTDRISRLVSMYEVAFSHKCNSADAVPGVTVATVCELCKHDNFLDNPNATILTCSNLDLSNTFVCIVVCCSDLFANNSVAVRRVGGGPEGIRNNTLPRSALLSLLFLYSTETLQFLKK